ncbi:MAG: hypothetical protein JJV98_12495 [Desulfosarcina sp.]|nr:hypothetical protein [Desulfobacterales bacterium]
MKTLFFPQTLIEPALAEALQAIFGPVTLLHPSPEAVAEQTAALVKAHLIELVFPCRGDGAALGAAIASFKRWASDHSGEDLAGLMRQGRKSPFFGEDATARIVAEVKAGRAAAPKATAAERLHRARLLLMMAQELDLHRRELATDFQRLEAQERRMIDVLKGEEKSDAAIRDRPRLSTPATTSPLHMLPERIWAWAQLATQAEDFWEQNPEACFLTDDADVLAHITDQEEADTLLTRHPVPHGSEALRAWIADPRGQPPMLESPPPQPLRLTLMRLPQPSPFEWVRRLAGNTPTDPTAPDQTGKFNGVLVGHVLL